MKEFRSQGLGTPHIVIGRGAQLFQEHPDLIVRFQAFLPLGYRPDIPQPAAAGAAGAGAGGGGGGGSGEPRLTIPQPPGHGHCGEPWKLQPMRYAEGKGQAPLESDSEEFNNAISYVHKIKTRFLDHPEIYRSFLEILHTYQKEQLHGPGCAPRRMSEEEVFTEVAHLFQGQDDLLLEFQQFLPEAKRSLLTGSGPCEGKGEPQGLEHGRKRSGPRSSAPGLHKSR